MKYLLLIFLSLVGGVLGGFFFENINAFIIDHSTLGATTARTTITNPWTFSATTTLNAPFILTTTDTATSTEYVGCIQTTATSTASPIRLTFATAIIATTTYRGSSNPSRGMVVWQFGTCPNLP